MPPGALDDFARQRERPTPGDLETQRKTRVVHRLDRAVRLALDLAVAPQLRLDVVEVCRADYAHRGLAQTAAGRGRRGQVGIVVAHDHEAGAVERLEPAAGARKLDLIEAVVVEIARRAGDVVDGEHQRFQARDFHVGSFSSQAVRAPSVSATQSAM